MITLDLFLTANERYLSIDNLEAYKLAKRTAEGNSLGRSPDKAFAEIVAAITELSIPFSVIGGQFQDVLMEKRELIRYNPFNNTSG